MQYRKQPRVTGLLHRPEKTRQIECFTKGLHGRSSQMEVALVVSTAGKWEYFVYEGRKG